MQVNLFFFFFFVVVIIIIGQLFHLYPPAASSKLSLQLSLTGMSFLCTKSSNPMPLPFSVALYQRMYLYAPLSFSATPSLVTSRPVTVSLKKPFRILGPRSCGTLSFGLYRLLELMRILRYTIGWFGMVLDPMITRFLLYSRCVLITCGFERVWRFMGFCLSLVLIWMSLWAIPFCCFMVIVGF
uniref:Uncharacterized protein n=1 Tax=Rhizophora mucronata TaxID=61149 RepID=A0A2P2P4I3_RHIMU